MMNQTKVAAISLTASLALALTGCDRTGPDAPPDAPAAPGATGQNAAPAGHAQSPAQPQAPGSPAAAPPSAERPDDPTVAAFLGLEAPKPATWQWQPPRNPMITANYTVPAPNDVEGAKAAHLNVYFFGEGMGGPIEDNIERWKNQFRSPDGYAVEPIVEEFETDGMPVTFVELAGEWMQMGAVSFTRDQLFLAAIVDAPAGRIFIRFAGDEKTVEANREPFMKMLSGMRKVDDPGAADDAESTGTGGASGGY